MTFAVAVLLLIAAGHGLLRLATGRRPHRAYGVLGAVALSALSGIALLAFLTTLAAVTAMKTSLEVLVPFMVLAAALGLLPERATLQGSERGRSHLLGDLLGAGLSATIGSWVVVKVAHVPVFSNDEYAIWALRGRILSTVGRLSPYYYIGPYLPHRDYPLLVPSLVNWSDRFAGAANDGAAKMLLALVYVAALFTVAWAAERLAGPIASVASVVALAAVPRVLSISILLIAGDVPLMAMAVCVLLLLALWVRDGRRCDIAAASILCVGMTLTKEEGLLFVLAALAGAGVVAGRSRWRWIGATAGLVFLAQLPWRVYVAAHHLQNDAVNSANLKPSHVVHVLRFAGLVIEGMARYRPRVSLVVALCAFAAVALGVVWKAGRLVAQLAITFVVALTGLFAQYLIAVRYEGLGHAVIATNILAHAGSTGQRIGLFPAAIVLLVAPLVAGAAASGHRQPTQGPALLE